MNCLTDFVPLKLIVYKYYLSYYRHRHIIFIVIYHQIKFFLNTLYNYLQLTSTL